MSVNQGTEISVVFICPAGKGSCQFPHPVPLPLIPIRLQKPGGEKDLLNFHGILLLLSLATDTAVAPIERVHLLIQNQKEMLKSGHLSTPYKGMKDCFLRTIKQDGIISLWRGNSVNIYKAFSTQALAFAMAKYSWHKWANDKDDKYGSLKYTIAICSAPLFQYPLDYICTHLATDVKAARRVPFSLDGTGKYLKKDTGTRKFTGMFDLCNKTCKLDGINGFYRGFNLSILGMVAWDYTMEKMVSQYNVKEGRTMLAGIFPTVMLYSIQSSCSILSSYLCK